MSMHQTIFVLKSTNWYRKGRSEERRVGKGIIIFLNLASGSITSWKQFENEFINQFDDDKTSETLLL